MMTLRKVMKSEDHKFATTYPRQICWQMPLMCARTYLATLQGPEMAPYNSQQSFYTMRKPYLTVSVMHAVISMHKQLWSRTHTSVTTMMARQHVGIAVPEFGSSGTAIPVNMRFRGRNRVAWNHSLQEDHNPFLPSHGL